MPGETRKMNKKNYGGAMRRQYAGRPRKRYYRRRIRFMSPLFILLCALCVGLIAWGVTALVRRPAQDVPDAKKTADYSNTFLPGVTVNGEELFGMTRDEAVTVLTNETAERLGVQVTLTYGDKTWTLTPSAIGAQVDVEEQVDAAFAYGKDLSGEELAQRVASLEGNPVDWPLTLTYNEDALNTFLQEIKRAVDREPVNATITIDGSEKPQITESASGLSLDTDKLRQQISDCILRGENAEIELTPEEVLPEVDTMEVSSEFILLAEFSTSLEGSSSDRNSNVALALSHFNGLAVRDGEQVSFNKVVGDRTEAAGFKPAIEFAGTTTAKGIGGGVCQASTTLYGAILRVPLQIDKRYNHKMTVSYVPASQDATVTYPEKDLVFTNTIGETLYFFTEVNTKKKTATVKIYGAALNSDYYINIRTEVIERDIKSTSVVYKDDTEGKKAWYTDQKVLYKVGKTGLRSRAYRQYVSIATGLVMHEELLSEDYYQPESDIYWRGVHDR